MYAPSFCCSFYLASQSYAQIKVHSNINCMCARPCGGHIRKDIKSAGTHPLSQGIYIP